MPINKEKINISLENNYENIFNILPEAIAVFNNSGFFIEGNKHLFSWLGYSEKELIGKHITRLPFIPLKSLVFLVKQFNKRIKGKDIPPYEAIFTDKQGRIRYGIIRATAIKDNTGKIIADLVLITDISKEKEAQNAMIESKDMLKDSEAKYRLIAENTNDFIAVVTLSIPTYFTYLSSSYNKVYGYEPDELVNTPALDIVHPDDHNLILGLLKKNIENKIKSFFTNTKPKVEFFQYRAKSKDGKWHYVESMANVVDRQVILVTRDICDRVLTEKMKTEFVSIASHQLRTPLTGIGWCAKLLETQKYGPLVRKQKELVGKIIKSNNRMLALVNDLLDVAKIEKSADLIISKKTFKINPVIKEILEDNYLFFEKNNIKISNKIPDSFAIIANRTNIKHVFNNLIINAVKYSKINGEIILDCKTDLKNKIFIVSDQGCGIPKDQQKEIFSKLFRASNAMQIDEEGTGLGLYIAKAFVELHKGKIWFESEENKGSTFYFSIPK